MSQIQTVLFQNQSWFFLIFVSNLRYVKIDWQKSKCGQFWHPKNSRNKSLTISKGLFRFKRLYLQNVLPLFGMVNKPSFQQYVSELLGGKILCFLISFQGWVPYPPSSLCHKDHFIIAPAALFSYQVSYSNTTPNVVKSRSDQIQC